MELYFQKYGETGRPLVILHGLFGSSDNWKTHGRVLAEKYQVYLLDQRNHGKSDWSDDFSYDIMAEDLHSFVEEHQIDNFILIGHSMGGKTALRYAQKYPETLHQMVIVDMGIKENKASHDTILEGLQSIDLNVINTRNGADEQLAKHLPQKSLRQFLLKNLYWIEKGKLAWHINLSILIRKYKEILKATPEEISEVDTLFINGGLSDYILEEDKPSIQAVFPNSTFYTIKNAGHWIHADAPQEFLEKVEEFLD